MWLRWRATADGLRGGCVGVDMGGAVRCGRESSIVKSKLGRPKSGSGKRRNGGRGPLTIPALAPSVAVLS